MPTDPTHVPLPGEPATFTPIAAPTYGEGATTGVKFTGRYLHPDGAAGAIPAHAQADAAENYQAMLARKAATHAHARSVMR